MTMAESFNFSNKRILDLSNLKNIPVLSTIEQKNIAILIVARNQLSRLLPQDRDLFSDFFIDYLEKNVPDFNELDSLFDRYFSETNPIKKNIIFKQIKPIEPLAVFLSEIATIFNKTEKTSEITIKGFVYNLILDWFEAEKMKSSYLSELNKISFQPQIDDLIKRTKKDTVEREKLHTAFDNAIEISEFLKEFKYKIFLPSRCIKGRKKAKKC